MKTFTSPVELTGRCRSLPMTYIHCTRINAYNTFGLSARRAQETTNCQFITLDASHNPHFTQSRALHKILLSCQTELAHGAES